ncbi:hypothetical protein LTR85_008710 [Meristemomyces frigidus]|nr:hypothetical protein LTR85_008710 [Meristemomyces frigidus]
MSTISGAASALPGHDGSKVYTTRRPVNQSFISSVKDYFKEHHPLSRTPETLKPHSVYWGFYRTQLFRTARAYIPFMVIVMGWPFAAQMFVDASRGVYAWPGLRTR